MKVQYEHNYPKRDDITAPRDWASMPVYDDGFYGSTRGGEKGRLPAGVFDDHVKPTDLMVWDLYKHATEFNVLHVCDYVAPYESFERYREYPGQIASAPTEVGGHRVSGSEIARIFGRPFFGGMERLGVLSKGPLDAVRAEARDDSGQPAGASPDVPSLR